MHIGKLGSLKWPRVSCFKFILTVLLYCRFQFHKYTNFSLSIIQDRVFPKQLKRRLSRRNRSLINHCHFSAYFVIMALRIRMRWSHCETTFSNNTLFFFLAPFYCSSTSHAGHYMHKTYAKCPLTAHTFGYLTNMYIFVFYFSLKRGNFGLNECFRMLFRVVM